MTALDQKMTERLGHKKERRRKGTRPKDRADREHRRDPVEVLRERSGTFEMRIVKNRQRRLTGVDEIVLSLDV